MLEDLKIKNINNIKEELSEEEIVELEKLLAVARQNPPDIYDIWRMADAAWEEIGCDNENYDEAKYAKYYRHPVWILVSLFSEYDADSLQHRHAISDWIVDKNLKRILDYGGGGGTLARMIADKDASAAIDIYEPFPSGYSIAAIGDYRNIRFVDSLGSDYDCITCVDVLEHVQDPLEMLSRIIGLVETGKYLIIANNFYPEVKCHLPCTFHFRYTFKWFARMMGLVQLGPCKGSHATLYRKKEIVECNWGKIRLFERMSKVIYNVCNPVLEFIRA
jgi:2-polyprenyl-6-hydroxyphenyl methylase/3-demethylubiquinone-9 3-methyltransferase